MDFVEQGTEIRLIAVFLLGLVLAASLTALGTQTSLRGIGGPGGVGALIGLGFAAAALAASVMFPATCSRISTARPARVRRSSSASRRSESSPCSGSVGLARAVRRAVDAEARREAS